jgi:hypothetical protein
MIIFSIVLISEIYMSMGIAASENISGYTITFMVVAFIIALIYLLDGVQTIRINDNGVRLELLFVPFKDIKWDDINEAGIAKIKISGNKYSKQLYVSGVRLNEGDIDDISRYRFKPNIIWFDYSKSAQDMLAKGLGM